nr:hypothetical protein [uncultured bacterium]
MLETERAFAARALVIGWKAAFLEYFAPGAVGFSAGQAGSARDQLANTPDPPKDQQLIWEPRYGDVAASGELGYLTGPARSVRGTGKPRFSAYASIWKRQKDGSFKVVLDVRVNTPEAVPFPVGFTRAPVKNRFTGDYDDTTPPLGTADELLNSALRTNPLRAYRPRLAEGVRFHRHNQMPVVGIPAASRWLASHRPFSSADSRYAEVARSGDLGYTWGTFTIAPRRVTAPGRGTRTLNIEAGFYARVWVRERDGQWKVALDVLQ